MAQDMKKDGSLLIPDTTIALPTLDDLAKISGLRGRVDTTAILQHEMPGHATSGIVRPKFKLPREFAGTVIIGENQPKIVLTGNFGTAASGGIVIPSTEDVANINKGTYEPPKLIK